MSGNLVTTDMSGIVSREVDPEYLKWLVYMWPPLSDPSKWNWPCIRTFPFGRLFYKYRYALFTKAMEDHTEEHGGLTSRAETKKLAKEVGVSAWYSIIDLEAKEYDD